LCFCQSVLRRQRMSPGMNESQQGKNAGKRASKTCYKLTGRVEMGWEEIYFQGLRPSALLSATGKNLITRLILKFRRNMAN
jgi:hypothetical protein